MKKTFTTLACAFLCFSASAQETEDKNLAAAGRLLATMGVQEEMANGFRAAMEPMLQPMIQQMGLNEEQVRELNAIFSSWWENDIDQNSILTKFQKLYAEAFSLQEIEELELFYETPLGKKMLILTPELTQKGMQIGMEAAQAKQPELMAKMQAFQDKVREEQASAEENSAEEDAGKSEDAE